MAKSPKKVASETVPQFRLDGLEFVAIPAGDQYPAPGEYLYHDTDYTPDTGTTEREVLQNMFSDRGETRLALVYKLVGVRRIDSRPRIENLVDL